jgi:hypothetical protein
MTHMAPQPTNRPRPIPDVSVSDALRETARDELIAARGRLAEAAAMLGKREASAANVVEVLGLVSEATRQSAALWRLLAAWSHEDAGVTLSAIGDRSRVSASTVKRRIREEDLRRLGEL